MDAKYFYKTQITGSQYLQSRIKGAGSEYSPADFLLDSIQNFHVALDLHFLKDGHMIDLGSGPGISFPPFVKKYKLRSVHAVDISESMLSAIELNQSGISISTQCTDIETNRIQSPQANLVIACGLVSSLSTLEHCTKEMFRKLYTGGYIAVTILAHDDKDTILYKSKKSSDHHIYSIDGYKKLLKDTRFKILCFEKNPAYKWEHEGTTVYNCAVIAKKILE